MKNKPKKPIKRIKQKFADLRLNQKIEVGYVFIVFLPVVLLTAVMLYFSSQDARRSFQQSQEQELSTVNIQLSSELQQISNYTFYFQKDAAIVAYLNSEYKTVSDVMYHWFDHMEYVLKAHQTIN
jgi:uncharacterized membrane-anchored protein YhcB (DUF1043 family)